MVYGPQVRELLHSKSCEDKACVRRAIETAESFGHGHGPTNCRFSVSPNRKGPPLRNRPSKGPPWERATSLGQTRGDGKFQASSCRDVAQIGRASRWGKR